MIVIEMREAAYDKLFDLVDEVKELDKQKRMVMCELEEAAYDCYEASKSDDEYEDTEEHEKDFDDEDEEFEMNFRKNRNARNIARMRNMRMRDHDEYGMDKDTHKGYRHVDARRRNRMKQYM